MYLNKNVLIIYFNISVLEKEANFCLKKDEVFGTFLKSMGVTLNYLSNAFREKNKVVRQNKFV